jgi:hypothetical protein
MASLLLQRVTLAHSTDAFGEAIVRASMLEAARLVKEGKAVNGAVEFPVRVFIRYIPDPAKIDVKFEECMEIGRQSALQCYIEANAPRPPAVKIR